MATRVLIVDDDRDTADFLKLLVEPRGDLARTASDAAQAREMLRVLAPGSGSDGPHASRC